MKKISIIISLVIAAILVSCGNSKSSKDEVLTRSGNWEYFKDGSGCAVAACISEDAHSLCVVKDAHLRLMVAHGTDGGPDGVFYEIEHTAPQCGESVAYVSFDNKETEKWNVKEDHGTHQILDGENFISMLKKHEKCTIQMETLYCGTPTYTLNISGLKWDY